MAGVLIDSRDLPTLRALLRAFRNGELGHRRPPDEGQVRTPPSIVALLHNLTSATGTDPDSTDTGPADLPGSAWNVADIPAQCVPLEPVADRVLWIRIVGAELGSDGPQTVQIRRYGTDQVATLALQDKPDDVRTKLVAIGLPSAIEVRGLGDTFNDETSWTGANAWAVRFPDIDHRDRQFPLEWYDDPDTLSLVARVDAFPWWPRLELTEVWKPFPSRDAIPGGAFLRASWVWGRGYVADHLECVL